MSNIVYIATSLDGYIADTDGGIDWLNAIPNPEQSDLGYAGFISGIDALVMGRNTFDKVSGFDCPWPYTKPVFLLSNTMRSIPDEYKDKVHLVAGELKDVVAKLNRQGYENLYIDGGITIQNFLAQDLIDELIITRIPVVLGGGLPLFGTTEQKLWFEHVNTEVMLDALVQSHYRRKSVTE